MNILKRILLGLLAICVLVIAVLPVLFNVNDFKPDIEAAFIQNSGLQLKIEDDLQLSVFPWIGVQSGKISIYENASTASKIIASWDESEFKVKLLSLLQNEIEVSNILVKGLQLNLPQQLDVNTDTPGEIEPLLPTEPGVALPQSTPTVEKSSDKIEHIIGPKKIRVHSIHLTDARINWYEDANQLAYTLRDINLQSGELRMGKPMDLALQFLLLDNQQQPLATVASQAELILSEDIQHVQMQVQQFNLTPLQVNAENTTDMLLSAQLDIDRQQQRLRVTDLHGQWGVADIKGNVTAHLQAQIQLQGELHIAEMDVRQLLQQVDATASLPEDATALSALSASLQFQYTQPELNIADVTMQIDESRVTGSAKVQDISEPQVNFILAIDQIDLDRYFTWVETAAPVADNKAPGALGRDEKPKAPHSEAAIEKTTPSEQQVVATSDHSAVNGENEQTEKKTKGLRQTVQEIPAEGQLTIGQLTLQGLKMQRVSVDLTAKDGQVHALHEVKKFYQGSAAGKLRVDMRQDQPRYSMQEKLTRVQIEPLLKDYKGKAKMTGTLTAQADLSTKGNHEKQLKASLNGKTTLHFTNGVVRGFDMQHILAKGKRVIDKKTEVQPDRKQTPYSEIKGQAVFKNGVLHNDDLQANAENIVLTGKGNADLNNEQLDYAVLAEVLKEPPESGVEPEVKRSTKLFIQGDFEQPSYTVDLKSLVTEKEKQKLYDKVDKKLGPGVSDLLKKFLQ